MHAKPELLRFCDLRFGVAQTGHFATMCTRYCKALEALPFRAFEAFRDLCRPHSWGFGRPSEASTKSQKPLSCKISGLGDRAYNTIKEVPASSPEEPGLPLFFHVKRMLSRSWLQVLYILYSKRYDGP